MILLWENICVIVTDAWTDAWTNGWTDRRTDGRAGAILGGGTPRGVFRAPSRAEEYVSLRNTSLP